MDHTDSFEQFRQELHSKVHTAQKLGMSRDDIALRAKQVGDWLERDIQPRNPEQRLLQELWHVSDDHQRHTLSEVLTKMAAEDPKQH